MQGGQFTASTLALIVGLAALAAVYFTVASGLVFGGVAVIGGWYGVRVGYSASLFWYFWTLVAAGLAYGAFAVTSGVRQLLALAWRWNAPLRALQRP